MKNPEKIARPRAKRTAPLKVVKRTAHPNSLANLIPPSAPKFSSTYQPDPELLRKPKKATRQEVFGAFLDKIMNDPRTGEETNRLAQIMAKAWRMFMDSHGEDDVKPGEFLSFCQFTFDGYFGKQGEKLTIENNDKPEAFVLDIEKLLSTAEYIVSSCLDLTSLESLKLKLDDVIVRKRSEGAKIING